MAESLPSSLSAFAHRRARADSVASFAYYQDEDDDNLLSPTEALDGRPGLDDLDDLEFGDEDEDSAESEHRRVSGDFVLQRRSSTQSRSSVHTRLLRSDSIITTGSAAGPGRLSQKVYMVNEDLTIALAGFRTSRLGLCAYISMCLCSLGLAWLLFRWFPRWYIRVVGRRCALSDCHWVVIEVRMFSGFSPASAPPPDLLVESMGRVLYPRRGAAAVRPSAVDYFWPARKSGPFRPRG